MLLAGEVSKGNSQGKSCLGVIGCNCASTAEAQRVKGGVVLLNDFWIFPLHSVALLNSSS